MKVLSNRVVLRIASILAIGISTCLLAHFSYQISPNPTFPVTFMPAVVSSFSIAIFFAYLGFNIIAGSAMVLISILMVLWFDLRTGFKGYSVFALSFFVTALAGFWCVRFRNGIVNSFNLKAEKTSERINILSNEIELKVKGINSLEAKLQRYSTLKKAIESLSTHLSLDEINRIIIEQASKIMGKSGRALLFLVNTQKQELELSASRGGERILAKTGDIFDHWILRHRQSLIVEDIARDFRFPADGAKEPDKVFRSLIASPLISEDKVIGILRMDSLRESMYTQDDLRLLDIIANLGAVTVENSLLYSRTQELATRDSLTGLFVRRYFFERFRAEIQRAAMKKGELSLLVLDIDHFKDYNDTYGHAAGDLVLKHLSKTINAIVREGDIVARYGGEEIIVLLIGRGKQAVILEAEEIRKAIKARPLSLRRHEANITVSIGVASYPDDGVLEEDIVRLADKHLYKAKSLGRDRVCSD